LLVSPSERALDGSNDLMSGPQYLAALRQVVGFREQAAVSDPLREVVDRISADPHMLQSRLLMRILVALTSGAGAFRRAELAALDAPTHALVLGMMNIRASDLQGQTEWDHAVMLAEAASR